MIYKIYTRCKYCSAEIPENAIKCPNCGRKQKKITTSLLQIAFILIFTVSISAIIYFCDITNKNIGRIDSPFESRQTQIEKHFAGDGYHVGLVNYIKNTMHNPNSFEHVKTLYVDKGDHLIVKMIFRGTNAFGGVVTNSVVAKTDLNGNVIQIIGREP